MNSKKNEKPAAGKAKKNEKSAAGSAKKNEKPAAGSAKKNEKSAGSAKKKQFHPNNKRPSVGATQPAAAHKPLSPAYQNIVDVISRQSAAVRIGYHAGHTQYQRSQLIFDSILQQSTTGIRYPLPSLPLHQQPKRQPPYKKASTPSPSKPSVRPWINADYSAPAVTYPHVSKKPDSGPSTCDNKIRPIDDVIRRINLPRQKVLVLLRGLPGSGKSTLAKKLVHNGVVLSADSFFVHNGKYEYDPQKLTEAHATVRFQTLEYMQSGISPIIIDNTNLETWEMEPYMLQAVKLHYFVALIEPETSWRYDPKVLTNLNSHGVPHGKIVEMLQRFDHKVNVHVLRKLIQPKIDIYKQQKLMFQTEAENTVGAASTTPIFPLMPMTPEINARYTKKAPTSEDSYIFQSTAAESLLLLDEDVPKDAKKSHTKTDPNELLSPSMKDLMDINFLDALSLEGKAQKDAGGKVPSLPSSSEKLSAPTTEDEDVGGSKNSEPKSSSVKETPPRNRGPPILKTNKEIGLDAIRYEDAVRSLENHFLAVTHEALYDLVAQCDGDVHYAANLLLDSGYEWKNADGGDPVNCTDNDSVAGGDSDNEDNEQESESSDVETTASSEMTDTNPADGPELNLRIDPLFAIQLEKLFGPVGFHVAPESYYGSDLSVAIDEDTACKIHSAWSESLSKKFVHEEETLKEMLNDENYAERLQLEDDALIAAKLDAEERDPNFPPLTTEALLLEAKSKVPSKRDGLASKIKLQQLYDMFPKIDRKAVDNVFDAHDGNLMDTIQAIEDSFRPHDKPSLVIAPEMIKEYDDAWLKIGQRESLLLHEKETEDAALNSMVDPTYDDLRAEATVHYHKRQDCFQRAQDAYGNNMTAVASFYSQQGHLHSQKLYEANKRAKQIILAKMNDGQKDNTLDLHMLHVQEAMEVLSGFLDQKKKDLKVSGAASLAVSLITGKGTHSDNGLPRIKPAVVDFLRRHGYRMSEANGGVIEVNLIRADLD